MLKSPLHDTFAARGAAFEEKAGWAVASRFAGSEAEGRAIRSSAGIWDHSDMGKLRVRGDGARETLNRTVTGDIESLPENAIRWTLLLDDAGKIVSDVQVYNNFNEYMVTCDAGATERVASAIRARNGGVEIEDVTRQYAAICIEGPRAWQCPKAVVNLDIRSLRLMTFAECEAGGAKALLSRIGYCGEYGYILFTAPEAAEGVLAKLLDSGTDATLVGRSIQDLLRLEVRSFNLARDVPNNETPLEAGLHWMIHFRKEDFPGKAAILAEKDRGVTRKLVAFELADPATATGLAGILDGEDRVGYVANFDASPRRGRTIGLGYLDEAYGWPGLDLQVETAGGAVPIRTISAPFVLTESNRAQIS